MNAVIFSLLGATLLAGLMYSLLRTLRRPQGMTAPKADEQMIISIYQNRLQQVQQQFDNGELDQQEYEQAHGELSNALAYELQNQAKSGKQAARPGKPIIWGLGLGIPLLAVWLYLLLGKPAALNPEAAGAQLSIPEMVARLERRLKSNPEDVQGWRMLGRSYSMLQNFAAARDAYSEAYKRESGNAAVALDYAEAMARANNNNLLGRPVELIDEALQYEPANARALILKGVALYNQDDVPGAVQKWKSVLALPGIDQETHTVVQNLIEQSQDTTDSATQTPDQAQAAPAAAGAAITVELSLAPPLAAQASPNDTVFIFAQAATGPKMPLAVARKRVADLPLKIVLDDSSAMTEGMNLSSFNQVVVSARVSKAGNATAASGDLQGKSAVIDPLKKPSIKLVIDTKLP